MKVSIIIPVRNGEDVIEHSVNSALRQTCEDIEVICVDDASEDATCEVLSKMKEQDSRLTILHFEKVKGALMARLEGIQAAKGVYTLFLDADDYLDEHACEDLSRMMEEKQVDVLHFSSEVVDCGAGNVRTRNMQKFVEPCTKPLSGKSVFIGCFEQDLYKFNLWNKIYRTNLCKEAFSKLEQGYFPKANDLYAYFLIALHADSYVGVKTKPYYFYQFGRGSTGNSEITLGHLQIYCQEKKVSDAIGRLVEKEYPQYQVASEKITQNLLNENLWNWKEFLPGENAGEGFDLLVSNWGMSQVAAALARKYHGASDQIADRVHGAKVLEPTKREIKTIGIFYFRMARGGVQRVISLQIPMFLQLGYKVVLFTDELDPEAEYDIPNEVKRIVLPNSFQANVKDYGRRAEVFARELEENSIDLMLYHAGTSAYLLYDLLLVKSYGISFYVTLHEFFSQGMINLNQRLRQRPAIYRLVDKLIVLSTTEQLYWNILGVKSEYVPNPVEKIEAEKKEKSYVLWIGRFYKQQKQYEDAVHIMAEVVKQVPEAKMKIAGNEVTSGAKEQLQKQIKNYGLEKNVELLDFQKDVKSLYEGALVHLVTSAYEAFPMTIIESKSYGVPLVTYDMPYLELLQERKGYFAVPQGDKKEAARQIVKLLKNEELREKVSLEAKESIKSFQEYDLAKHWHELIESPGYAVSQSVDYTEEKMRIILENILLHYEKGAKTYQAEKGTKKKLEKLEKSKAYRLGNTLLKVPHKIYYHLKKK